METIRYLLWLIETASEGPIYFWPITTVILAGLAVTSVFNFPFTRSRIRKRHFVLLMPLGFSIVILLSGVLMKDRPWAAYLVHALLFSQLLASIYVICKIKGYRWFALFFISLQLWLAIFFAFVSAMSATGDWL